MNRHKTLTIENNIRKLLEKIPSLKNTLQILKDNNIKYGIFAGAHVFLLTSNREPTDVDVLVADDDFDKLTGLFSGYTKRKKDANTIGDFFYLDNDNNLEFVSKLDFIYEGNIYPIRLTSLAWKNIYKFTVDGAEVVLLNPVDTILEKAISPRGAEVGKHDMEDIEALVNAKDIDRKYLEKRAEEMKAEKKITGVLQKYITYPVKS